MKNTLTALDIGNSKITVIITSINEKGRLEVKGIGNSVSEGFDNGRIIDMPKAVSSLEKALFKAEQKANCKPRNVFVGISGVFIESKNIVSKVSIKNKDNREGIISKQNIKDVIEKAKNEVRNEFTDKRYDIIHAIPQHYFIDNNFDKNIKGPLDMQASTLSANVHIIYGESSELSQIRRCVNKATKNMNRFVLKPVAAAKAVLTTEEKENGSIFLDAGAGTIEMILSYDNSIRFSKVFENCGRKISKDIALGLDIMFAEAERIKIKYGIMSNDDYSKNDYEECRSYGGNRKKQCELYVYNGIIKEILQVIFQKTYSELLDNELYNFTNAGIILTGGLASMKNIEKIIQSIFQKPVKIGYPNLDIFENETQELNFPEYSTAVGLLHFALEETEIHEKLTKNIEITNMKSITNQIKNFLSNLSKYFKDFT